jgi:hypothetical protein
MSRLSVVGAVNPCGLDSANLDSPDLRLIRF